MGNEHARTLFRKSPAAYSWLTGYEAPPLPWGTYKGQGKDLAAARMAKDLGRDLGSFMTQLTAAEAGEGEGAPQTIEAPQPVGQENDAASLVSFNAELDKGADREGEADLDVTPKDEVEAEADYPQETGDETLVGGGGDDSVNAEKGKSLYCRPVHTERELTPEERDKIMAEAYKFHGKPWESGGTGVGDEGIDCSRLVGTVYRKAGLDFGSPSSGAYQKLVGNLKFVQVNKPEKGDVVWFNGHVGLYDPEGEKIGKPLYGTTDTAGVKHERYESFGKNPVFLRLKISEHNRMCEPAY